MATSAPAAPSGDSVPSKSLKRLQFVQSGASYVYGYTTAAEKIYRRVRSAVPTAVEPTLSKLEERVASVAAPLVARAQDASEKVLFIADDKVDYLLTTADKTYSSGKKGVTDSLGGLRQLHETNFKTFQDTSAAYYAWVQQFADWAKDKLNPIKGGQAALETLQAAIDKAKQATDPDVAAKLATDAWTSFASVPIVSKVLETADPVTKAALSSFYTLHDNVVSWTLYKKVVDTGAATLDWATQTTPYKLGATYVYPLVQPVADPALDKLSHSKVVQDTIGYWKPTATAA